MNKEELVANLGTIARSGSKVCFLISTTVCLHTVSTYTDNTTNSESLCRHS